MAVNLRGRLLTLERERHGRGGGGRCFGCGWRDGDPVTFTCNPPRLVGEGPDPGDDTSMDTCRSCGRRLVLRIPSPRSISAVGDPQSHAR